MNKSIPLTSFLQKLSKYSLYPLIPSFLFAIFKMGLLSSFKMLVNTLSQDSHEPKRVLTSYHMVINSLSLSLSIYIYIYISLYL